MMLITLLQQELVLLPELQRLDIVSESTRLQIIDRWQKTRWLYFLAPPVLLALRLVLVSSCLYVGAIVAEMEKWEFRDWWSDIIKGFVFPQRYL